LSYGNQEKPTEYQNSNTTPPFTGNKQVCSQRKKAINLQKIRIMSQLLYFMSRIKVTTHRESKEFAKTSSSVLFVEGGGTDRFDVNVMESLFDGKIKIEPLGPADGVRFVSQAFQRSYPYYFFLVDRDTCNDQEVARSWETFGTENGNNLLILHKREIENYFLEPDFLCLSQYLCPSKNVKTEITNKIIRFAQERLFVDALNFIIISCREKLKKTCIKIAKLSNIKTEKDALQKIEQIKKFQ
jgi:hypothetical protein